MTTPRDPDRQIHAFLLEGDELLNDQIYDVVRAEIEHKRQRTFIGPWRTPIMNKVVMYGLGAAAVVVLLVLGAQFLSSNGNIGTTPTPQPTPQPTSPTPGAVTLASGSFTAPLGEFGEAFDLEAVRTDDEVSGTLEISNPAGAEGAYSVDVQCARTTDDGLLLIGGEVTDSTYQEFVGEGAYVVMAFAPGTPVRVLWGIDVLAGDDPPAPAESCAAYIDTLLGDPLFGAVDIQGRPIEGDLELGE